MADSLTLIDMFTRGAAVGALACVGLGVWRSAVGRDAKLASVLACLSLSAWLVTESNALWEAFGYAYPMMLAAYPVAGLFWLLVLVVFEDQPVTAFTLSPALALIVTGVAMGLLSGPIREAIWATRNLAGGVLMLHAVFIIARGWRGDLLPARRRARGVLLGIGALFGAFEVTLGLASRRGPIGGWGMWAVGAPYGGMVMAAIAVSAATFFLQPRGSMFGAARRANPGAKAEAADLALLRDLERLMAAERWRHEGLTIGRLAEELGAPEHRLRRLINQRLGHRNFADFLNARRIEAAKRHLADPARASVTVAAMAFDLGYGSLGPFNRAFRAATGATPTQWRRQALANSPNIEEAP